MGIANLLIDLGKKILRFRRLRALASPPGKWHTAEISVAVEVDHAFFRDAVLVNNVDNAKLGLRSKAADFVFIF